MSTSSEIRKQIISNIKKLVLTKYVNVAGVDLDGWSLRLDERLPDFLSADEKRFQDGVTSLLGDLKSSHTAFYHEVPSEFPPPHTISVTLKSIEHEGRSVWMFLDVFPEGPAYLAGVNAGDLLIAVDGREQAPPQMPTFGIGKRHRLTLCRRQTNDRQVVEVQVPDVKGTKQRPPIVQPKSVTHSVVEPGIGLLKVLHFSGALGLRFSSELDRALSELKRSGCDRLIVDLRGNIGGSLGFARLASYLCADRRQIGHSLTPRRLLSGYSIDELPRIPMPESRTGVLIALTQFAFRDKSLVLLTQGLGPQPFHARTVILINEWTNSAAEIVAAFAREQGLALVFGQKTRGNVLGAANFSVGGRYWLRLAVFGWFTSQGTNLEGIGVIPEVAVEIEVEALRRGEDTQLSQAVAIVGRR